MAFTINSGGTTGTPTLASLSASGGMQGQTVMETVTGTGFTAPVTVAVSGTGITVSNVMVVNSTTITVTFTIAANAPTGAQNVTVTTAGGTSNTLTFMVTMAAPPPPPDFTISAAPSSQTVTQGASTTYNVMIAPVNGFNGTVALSVSGLPAGASPSFTPPSVTGGSGTSTLTVMTLASTPTGNSTFTVTGTSGSLSHTVMATLVVNASAGVAGPFLDILGNGDAYLGGGISGDPFVSFISSATNLVPNDTNGQPDVFVACVPGGAVTSCPTPLTRVSLTSAGVQIPGGVNAGPAPTQGMVDTAPISGDGRFVAFVSSDPNVVTPATTGTQIYVRDTCVGAPASCTPTTFLASAKTTGGIGSTVTDFPSISYNGRVVAFFSGSFFLPPAVNGFQIIARDTCFGAPAGCTPMAILVSADNSGTPGNVFSNHPSVSGDGRFVAFESSSGNLVVPPAAGSIPLQIFERDTCIGAPAGCVPSTVLISGNMTGGPSNSFSQNPSVNGDGRFVVFFSQSSDILPGNTALGRPDVFLRDTCGGSGGPVPNCTPSTIRVSMALNGTQGDAFSETGPPGSSISATGRFIAFGSFATNLLPTPSTPGQIYVLDTCFGAPGCTRALHKVTVDSTGAEVGASSFQFALSGDGRFLAFTNFVGTPPNLIQHIFLALTGF